MECCSVLVGNHSIQFCDSLTGLVQFSCETTQFTGSLYTLFDAECNLAPARSHFVVLAENGSLLVFSSPSSIHSENGPNPSLFAQTSPLGEDLSRHICLLDPFGNRQLAVVNSAVGDICLVSVPQGTVVDSLRVPRKFHSLAVDFDRQRIWCSGPTSHGVIPDMTEIDAERNEVVRYHQHYHTRDVDFLAYGHELSVLCTMSDDASLAFWDVRNMTNGRIASQFNRSGRVHAGLFLDDLHTFVFCDGAGLKGIDQRQLASRLFHIPFNTRSLMWGIARVDDYGIVVVGSGNETVCFNVPPSAGVRWTAADEKHFGCASFSQDELNRWEYLHGLSQEEMTLRLKFVEDRFSMSCFLRIFLQGSGCMLLCLSCCIR